MGTEIRCNSIHQNYLATETGFRKVVRKIWKKSVTFRKKSHMPKLIFSIFEHFFIMTNQDRLVLATETLFGFKPVWTGLEFQSEFLTFFTLWGF